MNIEKNIFRERSFCLNLVATIGWLGGCILLASPISDPRLPQIGNRRIAGKEKSEQNHFFSVPSEFQGKVIRQVNLNDSRKVIALTFDDGPWLLTTPQVLAILKENNIKATFFWIGQHLKSYPVVARQVVAEGHAIGNHTWHHWYSHLNRAVAAAEIEKTSDLIYQTTNVKTFLFRPPGGILNNGVAAYARHQHYATILWSVDPRENDRKLSASDLVENATRAARPGGIILLHDLHPKTVEALPQIVAELKKQGYQFVTVPELLEMQAIADRSPAETGKDKLKFK
ncbi:MAG TPA: polysaccharide deacetylase family protein [Leptolyngbyaceae cyanobacterium]